MNYLHGNIPPYMLFTLIEYLNDKGVLDVSEFVRYCKSIDIKDYEKILLRDYKATISESHEMHPNGIIATDELIQMSKVMPSFNTKILDAGTGHGGIACYLAYKYPCQVIGIDYDVVRVIDATFRAKMLEIYNVDFQVDNAYHMSFQEGTFDLILRQHSVYGDEEEKFISEVSRVLKTGGKIAIQGIFKKRSIGSKLIKLEDFSYNKYAQLLMKYSLYITDFEQKNSTEELLNSYKKNNQQEFIELVNNGILYGFKLIATKGEKDEDR